MSVHLNVCTKANFVHMLCQVTLKYIFAQFTPVKSGYKMVNGGDGGLLGKNSFTLYQGVLPYHWISSILVGHLLPVQCSSDFFFADLFFNAGAWGVNFYNLISDWLLYLIILCTLWMKLILKKRLVLEDLCYHLRL